MLYKLFGTNIREKLLKSILLHPEKRFYAKVLAKDLKLQFVSARRELDNLEKLGLLVTGARTEPGEKNPSAAKGAGGNAGAGEQDKKYYQANKGFVLYEEVVALLVKAQILYEKDFAEQLKRAGKPKLLILAGFFVNDRDAPTDLLLVGRFQRDKLLKLIHDLEVKLGREINFTLMDSREYSYRKDITDVFLYNILEGEKIVVIDELKGN